MEIQFYTKMNNSGIYRIIEYSPATINFFSKFESFVSLARGKYE